MSGTNGGKPVVIEAVTFPNPQALADRIAPLGWCNQCIGEAKAAEQSDPAKVGPIHAAVTMIPQAQQVSMPGMGAQVIVMAMPACWNHIAAQRHSSLLGG